MKTYYLPLTLLLSVGSAQAATLLDETFSDSTGFTASTPFFADNFGDFFGLTDGDMVNDFGGATAPPGLKPYTGFTGGYLTGMDLDGEGASLPVTVVWTGIDITGESNLIFSGDFAEFFDTPGDIDEADALFVEAQIDGGGYSTILEFVPGDFTSSSSPSNGFFQRDGLNLGDAAQNFQAPIAGTGASLDLRLTINLNSGDEDFAVDNFQVNSVPEPSTALLGSLAILGLLRRRR